jgi:ABC-2 type transport system permease protein
LRRHGLPPAISSGADVEGAVDVAVPRSEEQVPPLLRALLDAGQDVYEARLLRPTLEDLFFHVLAGRPTAAQPATAPPIPASSAAATTPGDRDGGSPEPVAAALPRRRRIAALLWKELRQLPRKRSAVLSATLFPLLLLFVMPVTQMVAMSHISPSALQASRLPSGLPLPQVMETIDRGPIAAFRLLTFPLVVLLGGLIVPSVMASHTLVVERERRTLDLLVALPVTVGDILWAKLAQTVLAAGSVSLPLFLIDATVAARLNLVSVADLLALGLLLVCALTYSTAGALAIGLVAGDFRTANNVSGAMIGPLVLAALAAIVFLPAGAALWVLAAALLALAAVVLLVALRWITVERLLR